MRRSAGVFLEPSFGSDKRQLSPAGKIQNRKVRSFQCISQTPFRLNFVNPGSFGTITPSGELSSSIGGIPIQHLALALRF
jgi:hypothetical protein